MQVFRRLFPHQTAAELAIRTGAEIRHCERCLAGDRDLGSAFQAKLLQSDVGDKILDAIMGEARPAWWVGFKKQLELSKLVKAQADLGRQIESMQRGMADSGTVEAATAVAAAAAKKPVVAIANTLAASAAYWIASQAGELVMTPSADVGSIGAMIMHQDISGWLDQVGIKMTIVRSEQSPNKNEAHPFAPLSDEARAYLQGRANEAGADFVKAVASGRRVSQTKVREEFGQGRMVGAREAVARGMADRIATLDQVIGGMLQQRSPRPNSRRRSALVFD
ncbi:S49 family peptidase [Bradyrhizobium sp. 2S1]|uniref:S49 family peptidase n=1 Tax=Bradyrhizobium sp. 2S1 TaxID=1404429 RepID=UPI00140786FB|nr:S49 family peptidase [Bradyrhizobium sp. 2S1]MCK7670173.1 S49 family peptidase [Bradyrhizobium sp. 2S1]